MGHIPRIRVDPNDPQSIVKQLDAVMRVLDDGVEFGNPQDPRADSSTLLPGAGGHNGTVLNILGSFVSVDITATGRTTITCTHNLGVQALTAATPNVSWWLENWLHDGTGGNAATELDLDLWYQGGTVTTEAINLEVSVQVSVGALTINADHPVRLRLWFHPAVR